MTMIIKAEGDVDEESVERNRQDLIEVFKMCRKLSRLKLNKLFTLDNKIRGTRGNYWKLVKFWYTRDCCIYFFSNRVINR